MKLLIDMNLAPSWVEFLVSRGIPAVHWSSVGDPCAPDRDLLEWARRHEHVVFTNDLDFGVLLALTGSAGPSVVQVRSLALLPDSIGGAVVAMLTACAAELERGAIVTIDETLQRVRLLPIRRS